MFGKSNGSAERGSDYYGVWTRAMQRADGNEHPSRPKPFNLGSRKDRKTLKKLKRSAYAAAAGQNSNGVPTVDILRVPLGYIPQEFQRGSHRSARAAQQGIDRALNAKLGLQRFSSRRRQEATQQLRNDVAATIRELRQLEDPNLDPTQRQQIETRLQARPTSQIGRDVHANWARNNAERTELQGAYDGLRPYVRGQDVAFIQGVLRGRRDRARKGR